MARIPITWHLGPGTRHRSRSDAEGRIPSTEDRARLPENAHIGYASCILHPFLNKAVESTPGIRPPLRHPITPSLRYPVPFIIARHPRTDPYELGQHEGP